MVILNMIKSMPNMSSRDVSQWYKGGVALASLLPDTDPVPVRIMESGHGMVVGRDLGGKTHTLPYTAVRGHWPLCGALNVLRGGRWRAIYLDRLPLKQWRRTYNERCLEVIELEGWQARRHNKPPSEVHAEHNAVIAGAFNPVYPDMVIDAVRMIERGDRVSVAVNNLVTLVAGDTATEKVLVYHKTDPAGILVGGEFIGSCPVGIEGRLTKLLSY